MLVLMNLNVFQEGNKLIYDENYSSKEIDNELKVLESKWDILNKQSQLKTLRLQQAYQVILFIIAIILMLL